MWNAILTWFRKNSLDRPYWGWFLLELALWLLLIGMLLLVLLFL